MTMVPTELTVSVDSKPPARATLRCFESDLE